MGTKSNEENKKKWGMKNSLIKKKRKEGKETDGTLKFWCSTELWFCIPCLLQSLTKN